MMRQGASLAALEQQNNKWAGVMVMVIVVVVVVVISLSVIHYVSHAGNGHKTPTSSF